MYKTFKETYTEPDHLRAPRPNLGSCGKTGKWSNQEMITNCVNCVSSPGWYGEKMFYCAGKCMSEYNTSQVCSTGSLVAKTLGQCASPCYQAGAPPAAGGCSDDFDCGSGQICQMHNGRGLCVVGTRETQPPLTEAPTLPPSTETPAPTSTSAPQVSEGYTTPCIVDYSKLDTLSGFYQKDRRFLGVI